VTLYAVPDLSALIVNTFFGLYVYRKNPASLSNRLFALLMLAICIWQFGEFNLVNSTTARAALFWDRFLYVGLILAPNASWVLALGFPHRSTLLRNRATALLLFTPSLFLLSLLPTNLFISGVQTESWGFGKIAGPLYWLFRVHMSIFVSLTLLTFYRSYRRAQTGRQKVQSKYLMMAISVPGLFGILILMVFQPLGLKYLNMGTAAFASVIMTAILSYAIAKHRLMDIDLVLKKGTIYAVTLAAVVLPSVLLIVFFSNIIFEKFEFVFLFIILVILSISCIVFSALIPHAETSLERTIFRNRLAYRSILSEFSKEIVTIVELGVLCREVLHTITTAMDIVNASIFVHEESTGKYELQAEKGTNTFTASEKNVSYPGAGDDFIEWMKKNRSIIVREEWEKQTRRPDLQKVINRMGQMESEVLIPLHTKRRLIGFINLGRKSQKEIYSDEDIGLLESLANQTAIAIENAKLYEDVKRQKAVVRRADRLASLGTLAAGLAHEIRNPLVAIKTLVELLPDRIDDEEFRRDFLAVASGEVDRICLLVNELLEFARPAAPQLQLEDIPEIMDGMILLISTELKNRNLEVVKKYEDDLPRIAIDREQVKQVFLNILLNAIEATEDGGQVVVEIRTLSRKGSDKVLQVEIRDTGRGIPEDHLDDVFTPFFTTKDKGSGLGLAISHQIIQEHRGIITVKSRVGEGSSFFIDFPITREGASGKDGTDREQPVRESYLSELSGVVKKSGEEGFADR